MVLSARGIALATAALQLAAQKRTAPLESMSRLPAARPNTRRRPIRLPAAQGAAKA